VPVPRPVGACANAPAPILPEYAQGSCYARSPARRSRRWSRADPQSCSAAARLDPPGARGRRSGPDSSR